MQQDEPKHCPSGSFRYTCVTNSCLTQKRPRKITQSNESFNSVPTTERVYALPARFSVHSFPIFSSALWMGTLENDAVQRRGHTAASNLFIEPYLR